jgi:peroxiredoxin
MDPTKTPVLGGTFQSAKVTNTDRLEVDLGWLALLLLLLGLPSIAVACCRISVESFEEEEPILMQLGSVKVIAAWWIFFAKEAR